MIPTKCPRCEELKERSKVDGNLRAFRDHYAEKHTASEVGTLDQKLRADVAFALMADGLSLGSAYEATNTIEKLRAMAEKVGY